MIQQLPCPLSLLESYFNFFGSLKMTFCSQNYCLNSCWLKTSTLQTPKRAERARQRAQEQAQERHQPNSD